MTNLIQRSKGGNFYVVVNVPPRARHLFGGKKQVWKSTGTRDRIEAIRIGAPIIVELKSKVASAAAQSEPKSGAMIAVVPPVSNSSEPLMLSPDAVGPALLRWRAGEIERCRVAAFNGLVPSGYEDDNERGVSLTRRRLLGLRIFGSIPELEDRMRGALASQGIVLEPDHPALKSEGLRKAFGEQWREAHRRYDLFCTGIFGDEPPNPNQEREARSEQSPKPPSPSLLTVFDKFAISKDIPDAARKRGYVVRLTQFLGNDAIAGISPALMDDFKVQLRRFPNTKRDISNLSFGEVILQFERMEARADPSARPTFKRLAPKTIWNWFSTFNSLFKYALALNYIDKNPVADLMSDLDKTTEMERVAYDAADIAAIFSRPMFTGHHDDGSERLQGYRERPGSNVRKDEAYWLPIFCLWHGCRLEEVGAARVRDIKDEDGTTYLDLRDRLLKNPQSRRQLPLHAEMQRLGFLEYVAGLDQDGYLFPGLPHDPNDDLASTRLFSKWWGRWCTANADMPGSGFDEPAKVFHSFRHSFKRACREGGVAEEFSDLLTGHKGNNHAGRDYGRGVRVAVLAEQIERVRYQTFPI